MADNTRRKQSVAGNSTRLRRESVSFGRATKPIKFAPTFATLVNKEIEEEVEKPTDTKEVFKGLVANVPDVVVYHEALKEEQESDESIQKFNGVLMFADVSGFTALTESYTLKGESGVDALTTTLNEYMGMIVECILESGGDILKFAGDAFLALWKVEERSQLKEAISIAAQTSITIQDKCDHFMTDIGVELRVKLALSAGNIYVVMVETDDLPISDSMTSHNSSISLQNQSKNSLEDLNSSSFSNFSLRKKHYVTVGRPVGEVNRAEKLTNPGRIVMSPNAWDLCDKNRLVGEQLPNRFFELKFLKDSRKLSPLTFKRTRASLFVSQPEDDGVLRKSMTLNPDHNGIYDTLKDYVSPIVQEKLLDQQPLRYLSELRQVTVVFINLSFRQKLQDKRFYQKQAPYIQRAFAICEFEMSKLGGSVNKLFMFDKGCSILACFGLPGSKHDSEAAHALESSLFIKERMKAEISALEKVSIGVTTGPVFVGVMGHKQRHEYTIIGPKVNMAARIMMHYPSCISCDEETHKQAKLAPWFYEELPYRHLKGIQNPGSVYRYREEGFTGKEYFLGRTQIPEPKYPLLGRDDILAVANQELSDLVAPTNSKQDNTAVKRRLLVVEGEPGIGKTRTLEEIAWIAQQQYNYRVLFADVTVTDRQKPFSVAKLCLSLLFELDVCNSSQERKEKLLKKFYEKADQLYLLNEILGIKFEVPYDSHMDDSDSIAKQRRNLIRDLVTSYRGKHKAIIFCLDDINHTDEESWQVLTALAKDRASLIICTVRPDSIRDACITARNILKHKHTRVVALHALANTETAGVICQMLGVRQVAKQVKNVIQDKAHGVPLWMEQIVFEMRKANLLSIRKIEGNTNLAWQRYSSNFDGSKDSSSHMITPVESDVQMRNPNYVPLLEMFDVKKKENEADEHSRRSSNTSHLIQATLGNPEDEGPSRRRSRVPSFAMFRTSITGFKRKRSRSAKPVPKTNKINPNLSKYLDADIAINVEQPSVQIANNLDIEYFDQAQSQISDISKNPSIVCTTPTNEAREINLDSEPENDVKLECSVNLNSDIKLDEFPVPVSIVGICIGILDHMTPYKQLLVKCGAILGQKFSHEMLWKILPLQKKNYLKFKTACQEVVADKIFEEHIIQNTTGTYKLLSFKNTLLQEIASNLWLDSQRQNLHLSCAKYLENQLHLMQANRPYDIAIGIPSPSKHHITPVCSVIPSQTDLSGAKKIEKSVVTDSNMTDTSSIMSLTKILENSDRKSIACHQNMFNSEQKHEISHHSHYKRHFVVSLHEPILRFDLDSQGFFVRKEINVKRMENCFSIPSDLKSHLKNEDSSIRKTTSKNSKRIGNSDLISKLWSMHSDYNPKEKPFINNPHLFQRYSQIEPAEIEVLSKIYTQLAYQYREAKDVRSTLTYLIKSAEVLSTFNFPYVALEYICDAGHIVAQLVNGIDPLNDAVVNDDDEDAKKTKVYAPSLNEIALVNIVLGQVYMQIDEIDASLRAFLTALRMLNVNVLQDTNFGNKLKKICSRETIPNNYQKNWNCFGGRKKDLQNIFLVERCLNFVFHIIHDFDIEVALSEHQSIQKTNAIVQKQVQFAEMLSNVGNDEAVFDILSAQACAYLNQFQLSMLTTNDVLADESLQKLLTVIEKIDAASKLSVQNEQSISLKHSLIHHILVCLATVSVNKKNALNAEIVVKLAMDSAKRINNRNSIGVLMTLLAQVYIMKDEKQNFKELMDGIYFMALSKRNSGLFAWFRAQQLCIALETGDTFVSIDDTVMLLMELELNRYEHSVTCVCFTFSLLACYFARQSVALFHECKTNQTTQNMMNLRDMVHLSLSSLHRGLLETYEHLHQLNFFRVKTLIFLYEAMILLNVLDSSTYADEQMPSKLKKIKVILNEPKLLNRFSTLQPKIEILNQLTVKNPSFFAGIEAAKRVGNKIDAEFGEFLKGIHSKNITPDNLEQQNKPHSAKTWLKHVKNIHNQDCDSNIFFPFFDIFKVLH